MYNRFYEFATAPFENTANPRMFYATEQHREALAAIEYTIRMRKGIVLITGDVGAGKTTVGRTMLERCRDKSTIIQLLDASSGGSVLLRHLLRNLEVTAPTGADHTQLLELLRSCLLDRTAQGRPVVLFVDEAQSLSNQVLEQLRLLSNFDTETHKLLQLVLIGQPELRDRIGQPELAPLRQRIVLARQLRPLNIVETRQYIEHRLKLVSLDPDNVRVAFTGDGIEAVYGFSRGLPRVINVVCDNSLLLGFVKEKRQIDAAIVQRVLDDMVPSFGAQNADAQPNATLSLAGNF